jgi:hypothetical protein
MWSLSRGLAKVGFWTCLLTGSCRGAVLDFWSVGDVRSYESSDELLLFFTG